MSEEMRWLPLEPTPFELELMARQEEFYRQLITAFALTPKEIGTLQDTNKAYTQQQEVIYRKKFRR